MIGRIDHGHDAIHAHRAISGAMSPQRNGQPNEWGRELGLFFLARMLLRRCRDRRQGEHWRVAKQIQRKEFHTRRRLHKNASPSKARSGLSLFIGRSGCCRGNAHKRRDRMFSCGKTAGTSIQLPLSRRKIGPSGSVVSRGHSTLSRATPVSAQQAAPWIV